MLSTSFNFYSGVIHVHTRFSDGSGDISSIVKAAKKAGLSWVIVTDHNCMELKEGIYDGITIITGEEISPLRSNHYLAFDIKEPISPSDSPQEYVDEVCAQGGFGFLAHPDESLFRKNHYSPIRWQNKDIKGNGIEIWNWFSDWADHYNSSNIFTKIYSVLFKDKLVRGPKSETLSFWDNINTYNDAIYPAIFGVDAHALKIYNYIIPLTIFPYEFMFNTLSNIVVTDANFNDCSFEERKKIILDSIKYGRVVMQNSSLSKGENKILYYLTNNSQIAYSGDCLELDDNTFIHLELPFEADVRVISNGTCVASFYTKVLKYKIYWPAKFRLEVSLNGQQWIYTNPIKVR